MIRGCREQCHAIIELVVDNQARLFGAPLETETVQKWRNEDAVQIEDGWKWSAVQEFRFQPRQHKIPLYLGRTRKRCYAADPVICPIARRESRSRQIAIEIRFSVADAITESSPRPVLVAPGVKAQLGTEIISRLPVQRTDKARGFARAQRERRIVA